jgi:Ca2+/H+ antiporter
MMHFIDNEPEKENRKFWIIMIAVAVIAVAFIAEIFISFYLNVI